MLPAPLLLTLRLELRPFTIADVDVAHALWTDPAMRRFLWDDVVIARETAAAALAASAADFARRGYGLWRVHARADGALAGFTGLRSLLDDGPELVYGVLPDWRGRGVAVEAATAVLDHGLLTRGVAHAVAATDGANAASVAVLRALGMTRERRAVVHGLDTVFYRTSRVAWQARPSREPVATPATTAATKRARRM